MRCKNINCKKKFIAKYFNQKTCSNDCQKEYEAQQNDVPNKITGTSLTNKLIKHLLKSGNQIQAKNVFMYKWECDVFNISKSNLVSEFEVKVSRGDYLADFKKKEKHKVLEDNYLGKASDVDIPNKFYYAAPEGLIKSDEIPNYAGLIVLTKNGYFREEKKAPFIHKEKVSDSIWKTLAMKFYYNNLIK